MKVAVLVNEFFTNELKKYNGFGGFGILSRNYVAEYIPDTDLTLDTIIGDNDEPEEDSCTLDGNKKVIFFPARPEGWGLTALCNRLKEKLGQHPQPWLQRYVQQLDYDAFLCIEFQGVAYQIINASTDTPVVLWLQDPRPESDWEELDSMSIQQSGYRPTQKVRDLMRRLQDQRRLTVVTQGKYLADKGRTFYELDPDLPITYLPNPITVDRDFMVDENPKDNAVIFLGRLDSVKRPWLYYALAQSLPEYTFYVCGQSHEGNLEEIKAAHAHIPNLIFKGHVDGEEKTNLLKRAKVLVNTSIHEAIPVSFLEALSYGCLLVSCQNPDDMTQRFGRAVPQVWGDGEALVEPLRDAVAAIMSDDTQRQITARAAVDYVRTVHSVEAFQAQLRQVLRDSATQHPAP